MKMNVTAPHSSETNLLTNMDAYESHVPNEVVIAVDSVRLISLRCQENLALHSQNPMNAFSNLDVAPPPPRPDEEEGRPTLACTLQDPSRVSSTCLVITSVARVA